MRILSALSQGNTVSVTPTAAGQVANDLNAWLYSAGGLCSEVTTRDAIVGLRRSCRTWATTKCPPQDIYSWRNLCIAFLRRDLDLASPEDGRIDLSGPEDYEADTQATVLKRLQTELAAADGSPGRNWRHRLSRNNVRPAG